MPKQKKNDLSKSYKSMRALNAKIGALDKATLAVVKEINRQAKDGKAKLAGYMALAESLITLSKKVEMMGMASALGLLQGKGKK